MKKMDIRLLQTFDFKALASLYDDAGWSLYLKDMDAFKRMFAASHSVYGAFENNRLIGTVRSLSDTAHILYIQDIIVHSDHRRKGIGKALLSRIVEDNASIRQKVLITDSDDAGAGAFYEAVGFKRSGDLSTVCYLRYDH